MTDLKVGKVSHYYDKIGVAIIDLTADLGVGDKIKIVKNGEEFTQEVASIQVEHQQVQTAKKGQSIGLKVAQAIKPEAEVFKVS